jgi:hypothetical protein
MKKTGMAKSDAKKLMGQMAPAGAGSFGAAAAPAVDRREQRRLDQAAGLVPFAVKINADLVKQLQERATEQSLDLNELVGQLLTKALAE